MANFVTTRRGKQNVIRSKAFQPRDAKTEAQLMQRGGFKMLVDLYPAFGGVLAEGFAQRAEGTSVYLAFMAANMPKAIDKSGDTAVIDFSQLTVADGRLPNVIVSGATINESGITISFYPMIKNEVNLATDVMVAVALLKTGELWVEKQVRGSNATDAVLIPVPDATAEDIQAVYLFAKRADGSKVSKSVYVPVGG